MLKETDSIIIFGGRFPLYFSNYYFDNQEGGVEGEEPDDKFFSLGKYDSIQSSFKNEVLELSNNNKIILIYPIPEAGWNPNRKIYNQWVKENFPKNFKIQKNITTSHEVYKNRTKLSYDLLNSIKSDNIYRVYPSKLFCKIVLV